MSSHRKRKSVGPTCWSGEICCQDLIKQQWIYDETRVRKNPNSQGIDLCMLKERAPRKMRLRADRLLTIFPIPVGGLKFESGGKVVVQDFGLVLRIFPFPCFAKIGACRLRRVRARSWPGEEHTIAWQERHMELYLRFNAGRAEQRSSANTCRSRYNWSGRCWVCWASRRYLVTLLTRVYNDNPAENGREE